VAVSLPRKRPKSPQCGRPLTFVMVGHRLSRIARFSPPIREAFRYGWLTPQGGCTKSPAPANRGRGVGSRDRSALLCPCRERLASGRLAPFFSMATPPDEPPKRLARTGRTVAGRAFAFHTNGPPRIRQRGRTPRPVWTAPPVGPLGPSRGRRLSAFLQSGLGPVLSAGLAWPFGQTSRPRNGRLPFLHRIAERAFPSAHVSVRVASR